MAATLRPVKIFFAAPGDLREEREAFPTAVGNVQRRVAYREFQLQPTGWQDALPGCGRPQELINKDVRSSDLLVVLLHRRWGTPTGKYTSGTEEEFEVGRRCRKKNGRPEIWLFFKHVDPVSLADAGPQLEKVLAFKDGIERER